MDTSASAAIPAGDAVHGEDSRAGLVRLFMFEFVDGGEESRGSVGNHTTDKVVVRFIEREETAIQRAGIGCFDIPKGQCRLTP